MSSVASQNLPFTERGGNCVLALTAPKLGTTHNMRLVCLPSDSSLDFGAQSSSEARFGFSSVLSLLDCDCVGEGELSLCWWQARSSGLESVVGVCAHRPGVAKRRMAITPAAAPVCIP